LIERERHGNRQAGREGGRAHLVLGVGHEGGEKEVVGIPACRLGHHQGLVVLHGGREGGMGGGEEGYREWGRGRGRRREERQEGGAYLEAFVQEPGAVVEDEVGHDGVCLFLVLSGGGAARPTLLLFLRRAGPRTDGGGGGPERQGIREEGREGGRKGDNFGE